MVFLALFRLEYFDESIKIYFIQKYHMYEKDYVVYGLKINPQGNSSIRSHILKRGNYGVEINDRTWCNKASVFNLFISKDEEPPVTRWLQFPEKEHVKAA